ncbi:hypothetical protein Tco_0839112 [Tanacetum coccineum]|uniref:Uncharacterized protein n=1 Tax=Tanacetum coccineum TaxID=301880 RepID=A0ABQ5AQD9_9ASTR
MTNLPPPDHVADLPEDEPVNPKPSPIILYHAPAQPEGYVGDDDMEEDEEEDPDEDPKEEPTKQLVPEQNNIDGFALHMNPQHEGNMNEWLIEDDDEELKEDGVGNDNDEELKEDKIGDDDEEEMEMDENDRDNNGNNDEDDAKVINPYEEVNPLNRPPSTSDEETEFAPPVVPTADANDEPVPLVIQFGGNYHVKESSSTGTLHAGNSWVHAPGPMGCNLESVHRGVTRLDRQMFDRYKTEKRMAKKFKEDEFRMNHHKYDITALDKVVRENRSDRSKMMKFVEGRSRQFNEFKEQSRQAERLSRWEAWVRERIITELRFQEEPPIHHAFAPRADDPYAMVRDASIAAQEDDDDDTTAPRDSQPSETCKSPRDP